MTFDLALWRGFDGLFVEDIAGVLGIAMNADLATITIANSSERPVLLFSIHDGTAEYIILVARAVVSVHRRIDGRLVGQAVTLTDYGSDRVRHACSALLERIEAQGGFQQARPSTH